MSKKLILSAMLCLLSSSVFAGTPMHEFLFQNLTGKPVYIRTRLDSWLCGNTTSGFQMIPPVSVDAPGVQTSPDTLTYVCNFTEDPYDYATLDIDVASDANKDHILYAGIVMNDYTGHVEGYGNTTSGAYYFIKAAEASPMKHGAYVNTIVIYKQPYKS